MQAKLDLENVGGLLGRRGFELKSAVLNVIESPNAAGKSTVIKGLTAVLSLPLKSRMARDMAERLGIKSASVGAEPLVNVNAEYATIGLSMNGDVRTCKIWRDGRLSVKRKGDERFLFTSVLVRHSEVVRQLMDGNSDFGWVARVVSLEEQYQRVKTVLDRLLGESMVKLDELRSRSKKIAELEEEIERLRREREDTKKRYEEIQKSISSLPPKDSALEDQWEKLVSEERKRNEDTERAFRAVREVTRNLEIAKRGFQTRKSELSKYQRQLEEVEEKLRFLPQEPELQELEKEAGKVIDTIPELREEKGKRLGLYNLYESALKAPGTQDPECKCPLCRTGVILIEELRSKADTLRREMIEIDNEITQCLTRRDDLLGRAREAREERERLQQGRLKRRQLIQTSEGSLKPLERRTGALEAQLRQAEDAYERTRSAHEDVKTRLAEVEKQVRQLDKNRENLLDKSGGLRQHLSSLDSALLKLEMGQAERYEVLFDNPVSLDASQRIYDNWVKVLERALNLIEDRIEEQRRGVAKKFNAKVEELLEKLNFKEFDRVSLDEETQQLVVVRRGRSQVLTSLSTSERYAISTLLQIAIKESYMPEVPFLVIDEVILDFDVDRRREVLGYLLRLARERDWFVIVARIGTSQELTVKRMEEL